MLQEFVMQSFAKNVIYLGKATRLVKWYVTVSYSYKQPLEVFYKKSVLKNFTKFTGKHLCHSLTTLLKKRLWHRCYLWILWNFQEHLFYRTPSDDCFCTVIPFNVNISFLWLIRTNNIVFNQIIIEETEIVIMDLPIIFFVFRVFLLLASSFELAGKR